MRCEKGSRREAGGGGRGEGLLDFLSVIEPGPVDGCYYEPRSFVRLTPDVYRSDLLTAPTN